MTSPPSEQAPAGPSVSVVVCAYTPKRLPLLAAALASVRAQSVPAHEIVLVVDHAPALLAESRRRWPDVRVLENDGPRGLSAARNTGVHASTGEVVAFLDDDAVAAPDWLRYLLAAYEDPRVAGVGGAVRPRWERGRPRWFPPEFDWVVGCAHSGMPTRRAPVRNLVGANMSLRRAAILETGGFRHELGRVGTIPAGCEETDLCIRVIGARPGDRILYDPAAAVDHHVPADRARAAYFTARCRAEGRSKALLSGLVGSDAGLRTEREYVRRTLPAGALRGLRETMTGDAGGALRTGMLAVGLLATARGYAEGRAQARRSLPATRPAAPRPGRRVLMVTPHSPLGSGGVERHVLEVASRLVAAGAEVQVLCTAPHGATGVTHRDGVAIRAVRAWPSGGSLCFAPALWRAMAEERWDVVHVQSYHTLVAPLAMLRARVLGLPYVLTFHGGGHSSRLRHRLRGRQRWALGPLLRRAARLVVVAPFEISAYGAEIGCAPAHFTLIPNGTTPARPTGASVAGPPLPDPAGPAGPVLATIGRLERYKGHHRVIEALPHVLARRPDARLIVVGTGPYERALRRRVRRLGLGAHVEFTSVPPGDGDAMAALLHRVGVVCVLSDFETHPLVALEAVAAGVPVLVTDASGLADLVRDGTATGLPPGASPAATAQAIVAVLERPRPALPAGLTSWDACAAALSRLYDEVSGAETDGRRATASSA